MKDFIFLYGPPGSGKSTVGRLIAESLGLPFTDLDGMIEENSQQAIPQIFAAEGESSFRRIEKDVLVEFISEGNGVCSLGGGALTDPDSLDLVHSAGPIICFMASYDTLYSRLIKNKEVQRPLLSPQPEIRLKQLLAKRSNHYTSFSPKIDTDGKSPSQVAWEVQNSSRQIPFNAGWANL